MTARRVVHLWWWNQRGYRHGTSKGSLTQRAVAYALVLGWWAMAPGLLAPQFWMATRRATRYYYDAADTAVLAITGHPNRWSIGDHASAKPGSNQGGAFRKQLLPTLTAYADTHGIATPQAPRPWRPATPKTFPAWTTSVAPYRADGRCVANQSARSSSPATTTDSQGNQPAKPVASHRPHRRTTPPRGTIEDEP